MPAPDLTPGGFHFFQDRRTWALFAVIALLAGAVVYLLNR